jgi:hypothetical protein
LAFSLSLWFYIAQMMKPSMFTTAAASRLLLGCVVLAAVWALIGFALVGSR